MMQVCIPRITMILALGFPSSLVRHQDQQRKVRLQRNSYLQDRCYAIKNKELIKKYFVQPHSGSLTPADIRLRPLLGVLRTSGAVPSGLFSHPHLPRNGIPSPARNDEKVARSSRE